MQHKVIQTSKTKNIQGTTGTKNCLDIINTLLTNTNELSKHKSHELHTQYSPSKLNNNNKHNNTLNNNSKRNNTLANTIKQIIHYSGMKNINNSKEKVSPYNSEESNIKIKQRSSKQYTNITIDDNSSKPEENSFNKRRKKNLDNILSESDSCQEIDSMEEDSLSKGNRMKSSNMNLQNINNYLVINILDSITKQYFL